ncbi:MAG: histidine phosphatase family protein [Bacteroidota bacterium]
MKTLILCRHAKSDWPEGVADIYRPLKDRGVQDANYLGQLLAAQSVSPDWVVSSPARRAQQTMSIINQRLDYKGEIVTVPEIYYQGLKYLTEYVTAMPDDKNFAFIYGHNPTFSDAVMHYLLMDSAYSMPTCSMVCLECKSLSWRGFIPGNIELRWVLIPRLQRKESGNMS